MVMDWVATIATLTAPSMEAVGRRKTPSIGELGQRTPSATVGQQIFSKFCEQE